MKNGEYELGGMNMAMCKRALLVLAGAALLYGCGGAEKEPAALVTVQVTPAKRGPIELEVSADAVVYPLQQAILRRRLPLPFRNFMCSAAAG